LGRARTAAVAQAIEADRWSLAAMIICAILCLLSGLFPGIIIDWFQPVATELVAGHMPPQVSIPWLSIVPVSASRSSYNGLLLFAFVVVAALMAAIVVHRLASQVVRRAPFWDCGYPNLGVLAQYSATSLAQPIRRVFATLAFSAHEQIDMPPPGNLQPATLRRFLRDPVWDFVYAPLAGVIGATATLLNHIQFLTIRRYLSFVFIALIVLVVVLALWG
jgi:hydrogenase-4 component B